MNHKTKEVNGSFQESVSRVLLLLSLLFCHLLGGFFPNLSFADTSATLLWDPNTESDLAGYRVYRGTDPGIYGLPTDVGMVTTYTVKNLQEGITYFFTLTAYDSSGNESLPSNEISYQVPPQPDHTPPSINLTAPAPHSSLSGTVTLTAQATDDVGVVGVQFQRNGINVGPEDITSPYSITWNTSSVTPGDYALTAVARDAAGNTATSAPVSVTVVAGSAEASPVSLTFQNGLNGYAGTVDTYIDGSRPTSSYGTNSAIAWDTGGETRKVSLIRFNDIFGAGPTHLPVGASIHSATLTMEVSNPGHSANVYEVAVDWDEAVTYNQFGDDAGVQSEEYGPLIFQAGGKVTLGSLAIDVTDSLLTWIDNPSANQGWIFIPTASDGVGIRSSEDNKQALRPTLTVEYSLGGGPTGDTSPPTPPTQLTASVNSESAITLTWAGAADNVGVTSYNIYLKGATTPLATTPNTSYQVTGLTPNTTYTYTVTALDAESNESTHSSAISATTHMPSDTTLPQVKLIAPTGGSITQGTLVTLTASASDDMGIVGVQFQLNGTNLGPEDSTSPYSTTWDTSSVILGDYVLTAIARDAAGNSATSAPVTVTVLPTYSDSPFYQANDPNGLLSIEVENAHDHTPQNGHSWLLVTSSGASGDGAMEATPNDGTLNNTDYETKSPRLDFEAHFVRTGPHYVWVRGLGASRADDSVHVGLDGQGLASSDRIQGFGTQWTWSQDTRDYVLATIDIPTPGLHTINVWMREDGFVMDKLVLTTSATYAPIGTGPSESIQDPEVPSDTTAPTVTLTAPTTKSITQGTSVTLTASASDDMGIVGVQFQLNGTNLGSEDTSQPYSTDWNTASALPGAYILTAVARDAAGNTATSAPVSVTVVEEPSGSSPVTLTFQNGLNGYTGTVDTTLKEDAPTRNFGSHSSLEWDLVDPNPKFGLIRFDHIVGPASHQIPVGATIHAATLTLEAYNPGNPANVHEVTTEWEENGTYNQFGNEAGIQANDYGARISPANGSVQRGSLSFDVTTSVAAWTTNPTANQGWIFIPTGSNGVDVRSSEYGTPAMRPRLTVEYSLGK